MTLDALADAVRASRRLVVLTGAGMGLASGIPTFRGADPDAVWSRDVLEMATRSYFEADPRGSWRWYLSRFAGIERCRPNAGHDALVALERWADGRSFLLITQNIDTLHARAGSEALVEVHGRADRVRCSADGCPLGAPRGSLPRPEIDPERPLGCPVCGAPLRPHVLWFDEFYDGHVDYGFTRAMAALAAADLVLCVGTSFSVGITRAAQGGRAPLWAIDPGAQVPRGVRHVRAAQEVALPALVARLYQSDAPRDR